MKFIFLFALLLLAGPVHAEPISAALAVVGTAFGATGAAAVMTGLMVTGTAISAIGTLTGSKKLAKFGGLVSLAGGVGAGFQALSAAAEAASANAAVSAGAESLAVTPTAVSEAGTAAAVSAAEPAALTTGEALAKTPVAQELMGTAGAADTSGGLVNSAATAPSSAQMPNASILGSQAVQPAASPVADALATASKHVGSFLKDNKELVKLGGGLIEGAMGRNAADSRQQAEFDYLNQRRADYNAGVQGSAIPFRIQGGQNVTNVPVQDPMRFIPQRGLVNNNAGG